MDANIAKKLREPFPPEHIGKLPRVTCKACSNSQSGVCGDHQKERCSDCGNYVSTRHIHLDYVGHADVTARLIEADPDWSWEPMAFDTTGLPLCDTDERGNPVGLWIRLTVGGVTRLGYGSCPANQNDAVKVLIGDALRNAAMRFGVAVDLWAKGDRQDPTAENATGSADRASRRNGRRAAEPAQPPADQDVAAKKREAAQLATAAGVGLQRIPEHFTEVTGLDAAALQTREGLEIYVAALRERVGQPGDAA